MINAFDIETIPDNSIVAMLPEPEVAYGNIKDPEKIKEKIAEAKRKQIEKLGLDPFTGRICSFSFFGESKNFFRVISEVSDAAEIELVSEILENISIFGTEPNQIITWNGWGFDFPYVYKRAMLLRIAVPADCPPMRYWTTKYSREPHCDLMQELGGWNLQDRINLDFAGRRILGRGKTERDYLTYIDLIEKGEGEKIGLDNLCDTQLTYDIYRAVEPYLF